MVARPSAAAAEPSVAVAKLDMQWTQHQDEEPAKAAPPSAIGSPCLCLWGRTHLQHARSQTAKLDQTNLETPLTPRLVTSWHIYLRRHRQTWHGQHRRRGPATQSGAGPLDQTGASMEIRAGASAPALSVSGIEPDRATRINATGRPRRSRGGNPDSRS